MIRALAKVLAGQAHRSSLHIFIVIFGSCMMIMMFQVYVPHDVCAAILCSLRTLRILVFLVIAPWQRSWLVCSENLKKDHRFVVITIKISGTSLHIFIMQFSRSCMMILMWQLGMTKDLHGKGPGKGPAWFAVRT